MALLTLYFVLKILLKVSIVLLNVSIALKQFRLRMGAMSTEWRDHTNKKPRILSQTAA